MKNKLNEQFREALAFLKAKNRLTIKDLSEMGGCSSRHIQSVLSRKEAKGVGKSTGLAIANAFGYRYEDLLDLGKWILDGKNPEEWRSPSGGRVRYSASVNIASPGAVRRIPVISWVMAGNWSEVEDQFHPGDAEDWVITDGNCGPNAFALVVIGDSMEPEFREGEIIIVDPDRDALSGSYIVAKVGDNATFKRLILDGDLVYLRPLNTNDYEPMDMTGREFKIIGVVVAKTKRY